MAMKRLLPYLVGVGLVTLVVAASMYLDAYP